MGRRGLRFVVFLFSAAALAAGLFAQSATGRITGTVRDRSGGVVPGVTVSATNESTNIAWRSVSSESGTFVFDAIPPGTYRLQAEMPGFKRFESRGNILTANDVVTINIRLEVGEVSDVVAVEATYDKVQTSSSAFSTVVNEKTIKDLPLNGRNPLDLVALQPGVATGANTGGGTHINGARDRAINITLDGIDANETSAGTATFTPIRTNPDMLREYRVVTSNASAEFGRNSGAEVALISKSGTNDFHGTLYEFHRNRALNANTFALNFDGLPRRFLLRNQFGGNLGGPIFKDKTFFFFCGQIQRQVQTLLQSNSVYTAEARRGLFRYVINGRNRPFGVAGASVDAAGRPLAGLNIGTYDIVARNPGQLGLDPQTQSWIGLAPLPNNFATGDGLNVAAFDSLARRTDPQRDFMLRFDHRFNAANDLFVRYSWGRQDTVGDTTNDGAARFPGLPPIVTTEREPRNLAVSYRHTFSPATVNEVILGGNHFRFSFLNPIPDSAAVPPFNLTNVTDPLSNYYGNLRSINTYQIVDNLSHTFRSHLLKGGINFRYQQHYDIRGSVADVDVRPSVNFSTAINFVNPQAFNIPDDLNPTFDRPRLQSAINELLGRVGRIDRGFVAQGDRYAPPGTPFIFDARYPEYDYYIQDDWKLRPNLTLNLGLRWELKYAPSERDDRIFHPDPYIDIHSAPRTDVRFVQGRLYKDSLRNLAPSVGFAWDPTESGKTAVRANYRIAYDRLSTFTTSSAVFPRVPGITYAAIDTATGSRGGLLRDGLPLPVPNTTPGALAQPPARSLTGLTVVDPNLSAPKTQMWGLSVQRDLGKSFVVEVAYLGRKADHLLSAFDANQVEYVRNGFLNEFNIVRAGGESDLFNRLLANHPSRGPAQSGSAFARQFYASSFSLGSAAGLAAAIDSTLITQGGRQLSLTEAAGLPLTFFRAFPQFTGGLTVIDSHSFSNYHGLQVQVQRRFAGGLELQANYTLSKSLDDRSFDPVFTLTGSSGAPYDKNNRRLNYARSDFNRAHVFLSNGIYELPFGPNQRFLQGAGRMSRLVEGWRVSWILTLESGRPFTVFSGANTFSNTIQSRADFSGDLSHVGRVHNDPNSGILFYFNADERARFSTPAPGQLGNTARNQFTGPRFYNLDASLSKITKIREAKSLEVRADFFNLTNTPSFGFPTATVTSNTFGRIRTSVTSSERIIQLALRFSF